MLDSKFALLIDGDNISADYIGIITSELSKYGTITYKRIYGDWTRSNANKWKEVLLANSLNPVQQYSYTQGKNATDSAMIIDAMDILYSGHVNGFCLATSDSDFTRLSMRLRESGMYVVGMGESKTPEAFQSACDRFLLLDYLANVETKSKTSRKTSGTDEKTITPLEEIKDAIVKIITENGTDASFMDIGELGSRLTKYYPSFDVRNYEYTKFSKLLESKIFEKAIRLRYTETTVTAYLREDGVSLDDIHEEVLKIVSQEEKHTINMGDLNQRLLKKYPEFNISNYGYAKFSKMLQDFPEIRTTNLGKSITLVKDPAGKIGLGRRK